MLLERSFIGDGAHRAGNIGISLMLFLAVSFDVFRGNHGYVFGGEGGGGPVVPVGTGFRIHEEAVEQTETLRQRVMIGSNDLTRAAGTLCGDAISENGKGRFAVGSVPVAGSFHVAEHLIISAIFLDDVNDVLDRAWPWEEFRGRKIHQAVVLQSLLRVARERGQIGQGEHADVSGDNGAAVLAALAIFFLVRRKGSVGRVRRESAVVHAHRRWLESRSFAIADKELAVSDGDCGRILAGGNESE